MKSQRIGMLGAGNMAGALIRGLLASKSVTADQIVASDPAALELRHAGVGGLDDLEDVDRRRVTADIALLEGDHLGDTVDGIHCLVADLK